MALLAAGPVLAEAAGPVTVPRTAEVAVRSTSELLEALKPERGARTIHLRAGRYVLDAPLVVPDGVALVGEGIMRFDSEGLPEGFAPGTKPAAMSSPSHRYGRATASGRRSSSAKSSTTSTPVPSPPARAGARS